MPRINKSRKYIGRPTVGYGLGGALLKVGSNLAQGKGFGSGALQGVGKAAITPGSGIGAGAELAGNLLQKTNSPLAQKIGQGLDVASNFAPGGGGIKGAIGDVAGLAANAGVIGGGAANAIGGLANLAGGGGGGGMGPVGALKQFSNAGLIGGGQGGGLLNAAGNLLGSAQDGTALPSADFLLAQNQERDPDFIQMSPARPGEEMDTMGYTTAVDKTSVGLTVPVPKFGDAAPGSEDIPEDAPTPDPPTGIQPLQPRYPRLIKREDRELMTGDPIELPRDRSDKVALFGHGSAGASKIHRLARDGKMVYASPESHAAFIRDLYEKDSITRRQLDKMMSDNPGMSLEEASLRKAMGKTSYYDINNTSYEDLMNKAAQDEGGVDLYNFMETGSRPRGQVNPHGIFRQR